MGHNFISEDLFNQSDVNRELLFDKISNLKKWLYVSDGLGLMSVIDEIFDEYGYKNNLTSDEVSKFMSGLEIIRKTSLDDNYINSRIRSKIPSGIENLKLVRNPKGEWDYLNKLNTNYSALSELVTELIMRGIDFNYEKGKLVYDKIINNPVEGLLFLKPYMKKLIVNYFIDRGEGLNDFRKFCSHIKITTDLGEFAESKIMDYLISKGFEISYSGGNGDFIDMIFGCDLIIYNDEYGYKTVQVKNRFPGWKSVSYYKVDWLGIANPIGLFDLSSQIPIKL